MNRVWNSVDWLRPSKEIAIFAKPKRRLIKQRLFKSWQLWVSPPLITKIWPRSTGNMPFSVK